VFFFLFLGCTASRDGSLTEGGIWFFRFIKLDFFYVVTISSFGTGFFRRFFRFFLLLLKDQKLVLNLVEKFDDVFFFGFELDIENEFFFVFFEGFDAGFTGGIFGDFDGIIIAFVLFSG
jgi:hypothetical protein